MTLNEIRDWHAARTGWNKPGEKIYLPTGGFVVFCFVWARVDKETGALSVSNDHPFPPTLDGAASAMPEGYKWDRHQGYGAYRLYKLCQHKYGPRWEKVLDKDGWHLTLAESGDTIQHEIHDRYMLAKLACEAMGKEKA